MITEAERRVPAGIRIGVSLEGLGGRVDQMRASLDQNCGADGWALTPSGVRGALNDALSICSLDSTLASAFVARWCAGYTVETAEGVFRLRDDGPTPRRGWGRQCTARRRRRPWCACTDVGRAESFPIRLKAPAMSTGASSSMSPYYAGFR